MRKLLLFFILLLLFVQCKKSNEINENSNEDNNQNENNITKPKIDFDAMKKIIENSTSMDTEVFVAISVCHKFYVSKFDDEVKNLNEEEQKLFFYKKKIEFYKSIKYSEDQYLDFMQKNQQSVDEYIKSHSEILEYLTSIN